MMITALLALFAAATPSQPTVTTPPAPRSPATTVAPASASATVVDHLRAVVSSLGEKDTDLVSALRSSLVR